MAGVNLAFTKHDMVNCMTQLQAGSHAIAIFSFSLQSKLGTICDNLVLLQRSIASLVWEWNTDLQEFVAQQKKSEKTKADTAKAFSTASKPGGSVLSARGSTDVVSIPTAPSLLPTQNCKC